MAGSGQGRHRRSLGRTSGAISRFEWQAHVLAAAVLVAVLALVVGVAPAPGSGGYDSVVTADSPSHYWKLDETSGSTASDSVAVGQGYDLTATVAPTWGAAGPIPSLTGASFDPSQLQAMTGSNNFPLDNMSLELWFKLSVSDCLESVHQLAGFGNFMRYGANSWGLYLYASDTCADPPTLRLSVNAVDVIGNGTGPRVAVGVWHHVVATRASGTWSLYLDGSSVGTSASGVPTSVFQFSVAQDVIGYPSFYFNGPMTRVAFYSSVLGATRVRAHYLAGIGATQAPQQTYGTCAGSGVNALAPSACTADPVNSLTGAFTTSQTDLTEAATGVSFAFIRSYTSADVTSGRFGPGWTDNYAASLAVQPNGDVLVHGDEGQQVYYTKQLDGSFFGAAGALSTLSSIVGGYKLVTHEQVTYMFDTAGVLQSQVDRNGQGLTFAYTAGKLTGITDAAGHLITVGYNASNLVSSVATPDGRTVAYGYTSGRLTSVTLPDPDGAGPLTSPVWTYTYDGNGRLWQEIDPNLKTQVTNLYDPSTGRVSQQTDANGKMSTFAWDAPTQTATVTDPDQHVWKDVYQNNVLIKRIDPALETTLFDHSGSLDATAVTSPNGTDTTNMSYDGAGNVLTATAPVSLGSVQKVFTYDVQNNVKTVTDARGKLTTYGYDVAGNNNSVVQDGQTVFGATYNAQGKLLTSTDGNGKTTTYTYDAAGNVASVTAPDPDGAGPLAASKTTYTYDAMGNVLTKVDPLGNCSGCTQANYTTTYTYDKNGKLLTETDPLGHLTTHVYDAAGNETSTTDANAHTTTNVYDNANRLLQVTGSDPDGAGPLEAPVTKYTYDDAGNKVSMIEPRGNCSGCTPALFTTTYAYDQNNRQASTTTPKGEKTTNAYDVNGNLATTVEPRGNVAGCGCAAQYTTAYTYDAAGRLLTTTDPLGNVSTNHYDAVGSQDWTKDGNQHQTSYTYDAAGRILTVTAPDGGLTTYTYDGNGSLKTRKDDNIHLTTNSYDDAGRLITVTGQDPDGAGPLTSPVTTYAYDLNGNQTSMIDPNGNKTPTAGDGTTTQAYDRANRLTGITYSDTTPAVSLGYDNVGNRTSMADGSGSLSYVYDNLDRLKTLTRGTNTFTYAYDVGGNITSRTYPDNTGITYAYDEDNRLSGVTTGGVTTSYAFDPASHLTQATLPSGNGYVETRSYDNAGRLTEVKNQKGASTLSDFVSTRIRSGIRPRSCRAAPSRAHRPTPTT